MLLFTVWDGDLLTVLVLLLPTFCRFEAEFLTFAFVLERLLALPPRLALSALLSLERAVELLLTVPLSLFPERAVVLLFTVPLPLSLERLLALPPRLALSALLSLERAVVLLFTVALPLLLERAVVLLFTVPLPLLPERAVVLLVTELLLLTPLFWEMELLFVLRLP